MAALVEGHQYGLSSLDSTSAGKSVVHVKLTDSALKAIEEFGKLANNHVTSRCPSIQLDSNNGEIRIPIQKSSDNPAGTRTFQISLSVLQGDPKGSFDCIQQDSRRSMLEHKGVMSHKLSVQATDDVYKTTRERMAQAEEEVKRNCTKILKPGTTVRKVVKKVVKKDVVLPPVKHSPTHGALPSLHNRSSINKPLQSPGTSQHSPSSSSSISSSQNKPSSSTSSPHRPADHRPHPADLRTPASSTGSDHRADRSTPSTSNKPTSNQQLTTTSLNSHRSASNHHRDNGQHKSADSHSPHQSTKPLQNAKSSSPASNMPLKDRVIHLLALRSYKKLELYQRLSKDGLRDRDRALLNGVLKKVAVHNHRENSYSLARHIYAEIRTNWPFYTEEEKNRIQQKLNQEQAASRTPSPAISPVHSQGGQSSPSSTTTQPQKRPSSTSDDLGYPTGKKQRIAHDRKPTDGVSRSPTPMDTSGRAMKVEASSSNDRQTTATLPSSPTSSQENTAPHLNHKNFADVPSPESQDDQENAFKDDSTSDMLDYLRKYTMIYTLDQRVSYKKDFNALYEEYRQKHSGIERVTTIFHKLREELKQQEEGSAEHESIKNRIFKEYRNLKQDSKYVEQRKRWEYLHRKLSHVKKLIMEFDTQPLMAQL